MICCRANNANGPAVGIFGKSTTGVDRGQERHVRSVIHAGRASHISAHVHKSFLRNNGEIGIGVNFVGLVRIGYFSSQCRRIISRRVEGTGEERHRDVSRGRNLHFDDVLTSDGTPVNRTVILSPGRITSLTGARCRRSREAASNSGAIHCSDSRMHPVRQGTNDKSAKN